MNNLRWMEYLVICKGKVKLSHGTMQDLELWLSFIESAAAGISINRVVFRKSTIITFSDDSEAGIRSYSPNTRVGWRYLFSDKENKSLTPNCKEYVVSAINMDFQMEMNPDPTPF